MVNLRAMANNSSGESNDNNMVSVKKNFNNKNLSAISVLSNYGNSDTNMNNNTIIFNNDKNITTTILQPNTTTITPNINPIT